MTEKQKLDKKNAKAVRKMREGIAQSAHLQELVRQGKLTAGQALRIKTKG